jgi:hypothetical protein
MKTNLIRAAGLMLLICAFQFSFAGFTGGSIMGRVVDPETKLPVADATVILENEGTQKVYTTNEQGYYYASNIPAGVYTITVTYMSNHTTLEPVSVSNDEQATVDINFSTSVGMKTVVIASAATKITERLFDPADPTRDILKGSDIRKTPITVISGIAEFKSGVVKSGKDYYVRGARAGGLAYYIDGGKVMGSPDIPLCGLDTYRMYDGYIPAKYGDALGGVVVIETRNYFSEAHD